MTDDIYVSIFISNIRRHRQIRDISMFAAEGALSIADGPILPILLILLVHGQQGLITAAVVSRRPGRAVRAGMPGRHRGARRRRQRLVTNCACAEARGIERILVVVLDGLAVSCFYGSLALAA